MIEVDGVLVDIHKDCHRVAFNQAFEVSDAMSPCICQLTHSGVHKPESMAHICYCLWNVAWPVEGAWNGLRGVDTICLP